MNPVNIKTEVAQLEPWKSTVLARIAGANIKVMRMDGRPYPEESHDYAEGLLVVDGQLNLTVGSDAVTVRTGEIVIVPIGVKHSVAPGSTGTLLVFDAYRPTRSCCSQPEVDGSAFTSLVLLRPVCTMA